MIILFVVNIINYTHHYNSMVFYIAVTIIIKGKNLVENLVKEVIDRKIINILINS